MSSRHSPSPTQIFLRDYPEGYQVESKQVDPGSTFPFPSPYEKYHCVSEEGLASLNVMRPAFMSIPGAPRIIEGTGLDMSVALRPLATPLPGEPAVPVLETATPIRCRRCMSYMSPFATFPSGAQQWACPFCGRQNPLPDSHAFMVETLTGRVRQDIPLDQARPELRLGTVEYACDAVKYRPSTTWALDPSTTLPKVELGSPGGVSHLAHVSDPEHPACASLLPHASADVPSSASENILPVLPAIHAILVDTSPRACVSGLLNAAVQGLSSALASMPDEDRVCVVGYDTVTRFFDLSASVPPELVCPDADNPVCPLPLSRLAPPLSECRATLVSLLQSLQHRMLLNHQEEVARSQGVLPPPLACVATAALVAIGEALEPVGGRISMVLLQRPTKGVGAVPLRETAGVYGTVREKDLIQPATPFYHTLAESFADHMVGLDVIAVGPDPLDLASYAKVAQVTGGEVKYFSGRDQASGVLDSVMLCVQHMVSRVKGYAGHLRVRTSRGTSVSAVYGQCKERGQETHLAVLDEDMVLSVGLNVGAPLPPGSVYAYVQSALLYTTHCGRRRLRVSTTRLQVVHDVAKVYKHADPVAYTHWLSRCALHRMQVEALPVVRDELGTSIVTPLAYYRQQLVTEAESRKLILPSSLQILPLLVYALGKHDALHPTRQPQEGGVITADLRVAEAAWMNRVGPCELVRRIYPSFYDMTSLSPSVGTPIGTEDRMALITPPPLRPASSLLPSLPRSLLMVHAPPRLYLWVGQEMDPQVRMGVFGVETHEEVPEGTLYIQNQTDRHPLQVVATAETLRRRYPGCNRCVVVKGGTTRGHHVRTLLAEDSSSIDKTYTEFLNQLHKAVHRRIQML
ncbi:hypothetical protein KIPB_004813 [Kipferlia bialata]|uniref:Uncharacterized protein n=1 Tax=Kipferlia bialata TaxID=797122 RepID=A0A391NNT1_9EUKA|nr:hypothetical protein KIPB_004813 [Kipferlia bialata]|eukprot:g4813.t1